jgi:hypothetical protein
MHMHTHEKSTTIAKRVRVPSAFPSPENAGAMCKVRCVFPKKNSTRTSNAWTLEGAACKFWGVHRMNVCEKIDIR